MSWRICALISPRCERKQYSMKMSAMTTPEPVPSALPTAPRRAPSVPSAAPLMRSHAAPMLTTAFAICSRICETEVGTIVLRAWK